MLLHMQLLHVIHLDCVTKSRYLHYHTIIPFVCVWKCLLQKREHESTPTHTYAVHRQYSLPSSEGYVTD